MQNHAVAILRLGIPEYDWWNEGLHGIARSGYATVFPQAIGLAATWDTALLHTVAATISTEARAKYNQAIRDNIHSIYYGLTSGRLTSTSFVIRDRVVARKHTARIRI